MTRFLAGRPARAAAAGVSLAFAATLTACSSEDRAAIASAKCSLPVAEKAGFPKDVSGHRDVVDVEELGKGSYRVTGRQSVVGEVTKAVDFVCEVAPDSSDKLRGFKVTRLEVTPIE